MNSAGNEDCLTKNRQTEYGHLVAGRVAANPLIAHSMKCVRCDTRQTWMLKPTFPPAERLKLKCWKCGRASLAPHPKEPTR